MQLPSSPINPVPRRAAGCRPGTIAILLSSEVCQRRALSSAPMTIPRPNEPERAGHDRRRRAGRRAYVKWRTRCAAAAAGARGEPRPTTRSPAAPPATSDSGGGGRWRRERVEQQVAASDTGPAPEHARRAGWSIHARPAAAASGDHFLGGADQHLGDQAEHDQQRHRDDDAARQQTVLPEALQPLCCRRGASTSRIDIGSGLPTVTGRRGCADPQQPAAAAGDTLSVPTGA